MTGPTYISMGTQDEAPMVIEKGDDQIIIPYDDAAKVISGIAILTDESLVEVVQHFVSGHTFVIDE